MTAYDPGNIFGKMVRGEIPAQKVYEDENVLAIMDIFPQSRGHMLVIPKAASRNLLDADAAVLSAAMPIVQRLAKALMEATGADGLRFMQFNEAVSGQTVFHLHFHLIPVYEGVEMRGHGGGVKANEAELAELSKAIQAQL